MTEANWASPLGATIGRLLATREIDATELAAALHLSISDFQSLIEGRRRLTEADAAVLSESLGSTRRFWLARDKAYVVDMARLHNLGSGASEATWLASMPIASMRKFGWVSKDARARDRLLKDVLAFFGCETLQEWGQRYSSGVGGVAFRTSLSLASDGMANLVWLRAAEVSVETQLAPQFDRQAFKKLLPRLKRLSAFKRPSVFLPRLIEACRSVGVLVTSVRTPEGCRASGASWFDSKRRPIILVSFRHLAEDHFWFTFFHEAAHVVLHGESHIDGEGNDVMTSDLKKQESEANEFAQELLFPLALREKLLRDELHPKSVMAIARSANVTAGIIVGQLENFGRVPHGRMAFLKHRYRWRDSPYVPELIS